GPGPPHPRGDEDGAHHREPARRGDRARRLRGESARARGRGAFRVRRMKRAVAAIAWAVALAAIAADAPEGWLRLKINDKKKPTVYEAQTDGGRPVIHARAQ